MTLRRADIANRLKVIMEGDGSFGSSVPIDAADVGEFESLPFGDEYGADLAHTANILVSDFKPTIDAGPENEWEGERDFSLVYSVQGSNKDQRTAKAASLIPFVEQLLVQDRTLGLGDPQVYARITDATEDDAPGQSDGAPATATAVVTITVLYVAASAAG